MREDEKHIIHLLKQGDNTAYKHLFDNHYALLCSIAFEYLRDDFLAKTIVDDLIFNIWEKRGTIEIKISLRSYLVQAVRNRCINHLNLKQGKKEIPFSNMKQSDSNIINRHESFDYPMATLLAKELDGKIRQAIESLPEECKKVFILSRFEEKSYEQIAEELDITKNTVKYHIKKALAHLNDYLGKYL